MKRFRLFLAPDVKKEEAWLTEMSENGLHFKKYRLGVYYFEEDTDKSYIYQIDFQSMNDKTEYLQFYRDVGWEPVDHNFGMFHYFRRNAKESGADKIYSDASSVKDSYQRMLKFYLIIFVALLVLPMSLTISTWGGFLIQKILVCIDVLLIIVYIYMFYALRKKIKFYTQDVL